MLGEKRQSGIEGQAWMRVRTLFEAACALPAVERAVWLARECAGDAALLEEVNSLLGADGRAGALEPEPVAEPRLRNVDAEERVGMRVGPYVLVRLLGSGGMGAVYLARRDDRAFEKVVAVKMIRRGMDTDDILRRFHDERRILAGLEHPGVARLLDGGSTGDGLPYLVMEHVDGEALDRWCDRQRLDVRGRLALFRRVCEAVDFAHRRGIVHRDLKPSNVLVNAEGEPKLLDFGIAKIVHPAASARTIERTATELRLMTPEYASPEQVQGLPVGPASDVYSLGVVLYELLTGRHPHPATTRLRADLERAICQGDPLAPSAVVLRPPGVGEGGDPPTAEELSRRRGRTVQALRRELAGDLDLIVLAALRKEPERRYATAGDLADDLGRLLAGLPVRARPDTWRYRASKLVRRHRGLAIATLAVMTTLLVGALASTMLFVRAERARRAAVQREYLVRMASAAAAVESRDAGRALHDLEQAPLEQRGWEWRHLMARTDRSEETLVDLGRGVNLRALDLDREGRWMALGGEDDLVRLIDRSSGGEVARYRLPGNARVVRFQGGATRLLALCERRALYALALPALEEALRTPDHGPGYTDLALPGSEAWLAGGRTDGRIDVLDPTTLESRLTLGDQRGALLLAVSQDGGLLVSAGEEDLAFWDVRAGVPTRAPVPLPAAVSSIALSPDASLVALGLGSEVRGTTVALVDVASGRVVARASAHLHVARGLLFHPGRPLLASGALDETVRIWSVPDLRPLHTLLGHGTAVGSLASDPVSGRLVSVDSLGRAKAWSWDADDVRGWRGPQGWTMGLDVSPDARHLVSTGHVETEEGQRGTVEVRETATGRSVWTASLPGEGESAAFSPDGVRVAVLSSDGGLELRDALSGSLLASTQAAEDRADGRVRDLCFAPDGRTLLTAGPGRFAWVHDASTLRVLQRLSAQPRQGAWTVSADARGERLVTGGADRTALLLEARTGQPLLTLAGHEDGVISSAFDRSGRLVATGSTDTTIRLWRTRDGAALAVLEGHSSYVTDLAFSPDGTRLASGSSDRTVRLWSVPDGAEVATLRGHRARVSRVCFAPDGSFLASLSVDGELRIWDAPVRVE